MGEVDIEECGVFYHDDDKSGEGLVKLIECQYVVCDAMIICSNLITLILLCKFCN